MVNFKSFRFRLLSQFLLLILLSLIFSWLVYYFAKKKEQVLAMSVYLTRTHVLVSQGLKLQHEFYSYEAINPEFFKTHNSEYLDKLNLHHDQVFKRLNGIQHLEYFREFELTSKIELISQELGHNRSLFDQLEKLVYRRGFKDWGVEGIMRKHVHRLENYPEIVKPSLLLSLRRHEKDFILRNDSQYVKKLHKVVAEIVNNIHENNQLSPLIANAILIDLDTYKENFNQLVSLEFEIGQKTNSGLIRKLNETNEVLNSYFYQVLALSRKKEQELLSELKYYFFMTFVLYLLIGLRFSFVISRKITEPLSVLSNSLGNFVGSNFSRKSNFSFENRMDEIGVLASNVRILEDEIFDQINFFNQKVDEKTGEIKKQNEQILLQNKQIELKNGELQLQYEQIEEQKLIVENHNDRLLDSIHYAKRIQTAILPDKALINRLLPDHFIYYQPKDIVSGDFYWIEQTNGKPEECVMIGAVDCTGHGVPGAFMSVLGYTTLNDAIRENPEGDPGKLLNYLHRVVFDIFNKNGSGEDRLHDGMDLSLIRFYPGFRKMEFAGAYNSLFIVRDSKKGKLKCNVESNEMKITVNNSFTLYEIRGNRYAIGHLQEGINFTTNSIELKKGDKIYITTDGYTDQFGGPRSRRFQKKRFREMLLEFAVVPIDEQMPMFNRNYLDWKGNIEQIDDICVIGMEV